MLQGFTILYFYTLHAHLWWGWHVSGLVREAGDERRDEQGTAPIFLAPRASAQASLYAWNAFLPLLPRKCSAFKIQLKSYFIHQPLSALLHGALLPHFYAYDISL